MRIICAVDGSEYSHWGLQTLEALAEREPEHVTLVHVIDKTACLTAKGKAPSLDKRALAAMQKAGHLILRDAERAAKVALGQARTSPRTAFRRLLAYGPVAATIAREALRSRADLIMIGSRGLSDIKGFLLGSTSRRVASIAPCSVLVVKEPLSKFGRVTLAIDDSRPSREAAKFLRSHIVGEPSTVTILSSAESPVSDLAARYLSASQISALLHPVIEQSTRLVNSMRDEFIKEGLTAITKVPMGHIIETIIKAVESDRSNVLVVGSRRMTKSERLHLGSVSETLLRHAPCSVLIGRPAHGAVLR